MKTKTTPRRASINRLKHGSLIAAVLTRHIMVGRRPRPIVDMPDDEARCLALVITLQREAAHTCGYCGAKPNEECSCNDVTNCEFVGYRDHYFCGVCNRHETPRFICGCPPSEEFRKFYTAPP